ncbi:phage tail protein [Enterobacter kobei]|uniref:phage tail protein n=1 Tax=Enterobacter kobei TaxID=208224 RepID=UPI003CF37889
MAIEEYVGSIVMEIDSQEIEITDFDVQASTGRKLVKTMNKAGRAKGISRGIATWELSISAVIPETDIPDWANLEGVKVTIYPLNKSDKRTSYLDCFTTEVGEKYTVDNEAKIDIKMGALNKVDL